MLSTPELIIIFLIIMLVYGGTRLPAMGRGLGQGVREFREGLRGHSDSATNEAQKAAETAQKVAQDAAGEAARTDKSRQG